MSRAGALLFIIVTILTLSSCTAAPGGDASGAVQALQGYLTALVDKDEAKLTSLTCPDFETDALLEYDSFQAVKTQLAGLTCQPAGSENGDVLVNCQGKILASYTNEAQEFDLSSRVYRMTKSGADWQVCGYTVK